ncbi:MAG: hypothetical protein AAGI53_11290 [Planctomycetota bacterium]
MVNGAIELSLAWVAITVSFASAQLPSRPLDVPSSELVDSDGPDRVVEAYLSRFGLTDVLAEQLRRRLETAEAGERLEIAERLGAIYADLLAVSRSDTETRRLEAQSRELLEAVPNAGSHELRINLAKARYLPSERTAERHRIRLVGDDEAATAREVLETLARELRQLAGEITLEIRRLEGVEDRGSAQINDIRDRLADRRRLRALASYYAGWSSTYLATMSGRSDAARDGLRAFAIVLGADDDIPSLERLPRGLLRREPVSRSALGVAVCLGVLGRTQDAIEWLEELRGNPDVPDAVRRQVLSRHLTVLARERRWDHLDLLVNEARNGGSIRPVAGEAEQPLKVAEARLLAIEVLESVAGLALDDPRRNEAERIASAALSDLVAQGEVGHVLDLLGRYGSLPLGGDGFIVRYVRGLRAYDRARQAHADAGDDPERATNDDAVRALYIDAAGLLTEAFDATDAPRFAGERAKCGLLLGLCGYYRGAYVRAAERLETVAELAQGDEREEAVWLALVALDAALDDAQASPDDARAAELSAKRDQLAAMYLSQFPKTERAATLLLRRAASVGVEDEQAAAVLLSVRPGSPLYATAQRQAEARLYRVVRAASGAERERQAARYLTIATEVLEADRLEAFQSEGEAAADAFESAQFRARRILDTALSLPTPDLAVVERTLVVIDEIGARLGLDVDEQTASEWVFRRVQIAAHRDQSGQVEALLALLEVESDAAYESAVRFLYNRSLRIAERSPGDVATLEDLVRRGRAVLEAAREGGRTSVAEAAAVRDRVSRAAATLWTETGDEAMRDTAIAYDARSLDMGTAGGDALRRLGRLAESAGNDALALDAWRTLSAGARNGTREWFEARYHAIRLLARTEPSKAADAFAQHEALYPDGGPEPWGERFKALGRELQSVQAQGTGGAP